MVPFVADIFNSCVVHIETGAQLQKSRDHAIVLHLSGESSVSTPVMIFKIVDLPEPLVPMMPTVSAFLHFKRKVIQSIKFLWYSL